MNTNESTPTVSAYEDVVRPGGGFGYGLWPIIDRSDNISEDQDQGKPLSPPPPLRRGRGRPPVKKPRNDSAIEKRRAQVREAQRAYQKRKDKATATEKHRSDELLQLLSDLSTDVEALLQAASTAGHMHRSDEVSKGIQRLWSTYNTVVNTDCVIPELRLLQLKNSRRLASHHTNPILSVANDPGATHADHESGVPLRKSPNSFDPSALSFELVRFEGTTVMQSFQRTAATEKYMGGKSMFNIMKERQAAMKAADRRQAELGSNAE